MKRVTATKRLELRVPPDELATIDRYCRATSRTRSDVLREYIRSLGEKIKGAAIPAQPR